MFITDTDKRIDLNCKRKNSTKLSLKKKRHFNSLSSFIYYFYNSLSLKVSFSSLGNTDYF